MVQQEYTFHDEHHSNKKKGGIGKFIWNSETREFLGRDGASWGKVSLFYAVFYACLGSFFVGMLAVFIKFLPTDRPTYYGESSTMNARQLNPGLGFRPQIDVEDSTISINPSVKDNPAYGYIKYVRNLEQFLNAKYPELSSELKENVIKCESNKTYSDELTSDKSCKFDYKEIFADTPCTSEKNFGYDTSSPCVLVKLNKIISWEPETNTTGVSIRCYGETSADRDNIKSVIYHSENNLNNKLEGVLDKKYFPFFGQKSYRAPFVWVQFNIPDNTLVNIECKAVAINIDVDRMNRRGLTKFSLFIKNNK